MLTANVLIMTAFISISRENTNMLVSKKYATEYLATPDDSSDP
jgi:hypothetical protein